MWQRRDPTSLSDDVIIIGCHMSNERWTLTCVDGAWTGDVIGNCSTGTLSAFRSFIYIFARWQHTTLSCYNVVYMNRS